jgi:hypothetical protein
MTQLADITGHSLSLECSCGHAALLSVDRLLERLPPTTTLAHIVAEARCKACGCKGQVLFPRIIYAVPGQVFGT